MPKINKSARILSALLLIVAFIGFADATYLAVEYLSGDVPTCGTGGCGTVTRSEYAEIFGIPVALLGSGYYLTMLILGMIYAQRHDRRLISVMTLLSTIGFFASVRFVYLQLVVLNAICVYCMASAVSSTILWIIALILWRSSHPTTSSDSNTSSPASPEVAS
jgi:uncharacterized membrane protein